MLGTQNEYQQVIEAFVETFIDLSESGLVRMYGFGAKLDFPELKSDSAVFQFPCTGISSNDGDRVHGIDQVLEAYSYALRHIEMSGPTYFSPLFTQMLKILDSSDAYELDKYMVFLVITDGIFYDMQETINQVVAASYKPISLIIVGIGDAHEDFEGFYHLASLECCDSKGNKPCRAMCRFIHFK